MTTGRPCSIARSLDVLGERWALLVLRELVLGVQRFDQIAAGTGAPRDILTKRLRGLEAAGLVSRRAYSERPPRFDYELTELGRGTVEILLTLMDFGDRHLSGEPPVHWHHAADAHVLRPQLVCQDCGRPATENLHDPTGPGAPSNAAR